ncbi:hypothetical protein BDN70DRAFT_886607 [Pholiota conissans]|uniref:Uncharacterized protein n=1 Tax=Pholiota conissans TaxID=109636 RepID=A0A9P6CU46_9AGAR|nr:hypothetical protein BDN70DRAFT_886607 [Pholiota conissans]
MFSVFEVRVPTDLHCSHVVALLAGLFLQTLTSPSILINTSSGVHASQQAHTARIVCRVINEIDSSRALQDVFA